jgi:hypothetical protein
MDVVEEQRLLRGLLDASTTELQVQARDLAALAAQGKVMLPSQQGSSNEAGSEADDAG